MSFMLDTTPDAERFYYDLLASKTPSQRLSRSIDLSAWLGSIAIEEIMRANPELTAREAAIEFLRRAMTPDEFTALFPVSKIESK